MDNLENSEIEKPKIKAISKKTPIVKSQAAVKPLVEGINSPKTMSDVNISKPALTKPTNLTLQEKKLIDETPETAAVVKTRPQLMPESVVNRVNKKPRGIKFLILPIIIVLILLAGLYQAYIWNKNKYSAPEENTVYTGSQAVPAPELATNTQPTLATSTETSTSTPKNNSSTSPLSLGTFFGSGNSTSTPNQIKITPTPTGYLNVRSTPSSSGKVVGQVHPGETYIYTKSQNSWYQITLKDGTSGWISAQYTTAK